MGNKLKVVLNREGVGQLLKSEEMRRILEGHAKNLAAKTGGDTEVYTAQTRAVAKVGGDDGNNRLLKALGGSR